MSGHPDILLAIIGSFDDTVSDIVDLESTVEVFGGDTSIHRAAPEVALNSARKDLAELYTRVLDRKGLIQE